MAVRKPWDIPPIPKRGDSEENITFESVGRALTGWEIFEIELSRLFSSLTGTGDGTIASIRAYGSVLTFRGRAEMIEAAASVHFSLLPDKDFEKAMKDLLTAGARYAARRNEIAHGV